VNDRDHPILLPGWAGVRFLAALPAAVTAGRSHQPGSARRFEERGSSLYV